MHKSMVFYCLVLSECQYISFSQLRFSLSLGNLPNSRYPPATNAVNYPQINISRDSLRGPRFVSSVIYISVLLRKRVQQQPEERKHLIRKIRVRIWLSAFWHVITWRQSHRQTLNFIHKINKIKFVNAITSTYSQVQTLNS